MSELGAVLLVFSGSSILFAICMALLGLDLTNSRNLSRLLTLELWDDLKQRRGKKRLSRRWSHFLLSFWQPFQNACLQHLGLVHRRHALRISGIAICMNFVWLSLALATLIGLMLSDDLSNRYVVSHSSQDLAIFFRITGIWAGSSGSLLFWYWMLSLFCAITVIQIGLFARSDKPKARSCKQDLSLNNKGGRYTYPARQQALIVLFLAGIQLSFVGLSLFFRDAQAFRIYPMAMEAGRGLNPLLLHWAMIIHPPILYVGYVSSAIPCILLLSAVISGRAHSMSFSLLRRWSIFSWFFLGTGILLGSKWAYEELGWGGYWAWDPVENASLMPWLLATAFLHSLIVQERRGLLRFWNVVLVTLSYHMALLGTWITRSGILEGPHTFSQSSIGMPMLLFICASALFFLRFLYFSRKQLAPRQVMMEAITSKEGSLLLNNFLMVSAMLIILLGVFSPLLPLDCSITEQGLQCYKVEWKQGIYNRLLVPLGLSTLFLMGASPLFPWRRSVFRVWSKNLVRPLLAGLVGGVAFSLVYGLLFTRIPEPDLGTWGSSLVSEIMAIATVAIAVFVITGIIQEYAQGIRSRRLRFGENIPRACLRLLFNNKRRYGGYLVHLSIVFLFIGYAGSAFKKTRKFEFHYYKQPWHDKSETIHYYSGDQAYLGNYSIQARELFFRPVNEEKTDSKNPTHFTIAQEAHYYMQQKGNSRSPARPTFGKQAQAQAHPPQRPWDEFLSFFTGHHANHYIRTQRHFYPQIDPISGKVLRNSQRQAVYTPTSKPGIYSQWSEDLYMQLGALSVPQSNGNTPLNYFYEAYYHLFGKSKLAYTELFPPSLEATLEVWINPAVKFIWLGSLLFFLASLLLLLPLGESRKE